MNDTVLISRANDLLNELISCLSEAERNLTSARNLGFLDIMGGGFFVDLIKHSKLNNAKDSMERVNYLMNELSLTLRNISFPDDLRMNIGAFETFADFFFDDGIMDFYMTAKIMSSLKEVRNLKEKCLLLKDYLNRVN